MTLVLSDWDAGQDVQVDLLICALGYESRAVKASNKYSWNANQKYAFSYKDQEQLSFTKNELFFTENSFQIIKSSNGTFAKDFVNVLGAQKLRGESLQLIIDITCFSRFRLAVMLESLLEYAKENRVVLYIAYTISDYVPPSDTHSTNSRVGPVTDAFAGWSCDPDLPPAAVVGLGYEKRKALGAVEYLQSANVWLFAPQSPVKQFFKDVLDVNSGLIESIPSERILEYRVEQPALTYTVLNSLISGLCAQFNPVVMPFGPKIFFLLCLLVSVHYPSVSIWSVDGEESEAPIDRHGSDHTISFCIEIGSPTT
jgi:hypothetical protein